MDGDGVLYWSSILRSNVIHVRPPQYGLAAVALCESILHDDTETQDR